MLVIEWIIFVIKAAFKLHETMISIQGGQFVHVIIGELECESLQV